jgi:hypothetical protein
MLTGKVTALGEKPAQCHFVHHKHYMNWPETEVGRLRCETSINFTANAACIRNENLKFLKIEFREFCCDRKR